MTPSKRLPKRSPFIPGAVLGRLHCADAMRVSGLRTIVGIRVHSLRQGFQRRAAPETLITSQERFLRLYST